MFPEKKKKFFVVDSLAPGNYKIAKRTDCLAVRGRTKNNCNHKNSKTIKFKLKSKSITILREGFKVKQSWEKNMNMVREKFVALNDTQLINITDELKQLKNYNKWMIID